jgi:hypothetical protein
LITDEQKTSLDKFTELEKTTEKDREIKEIKYDLDLHEGKPIPDRQMTVIRGPRLIEGKQD